MNHRFEIVPSLLLLNELELTSELENKEKQIKEEALQNKNHY